jgi:hypothetical protein
MSEFQATWLHLFIITEDCHSQGLQVCSVIAWYYLVIARLPAKSAGQVCRACLPGKSAGQVCRASLPGRSAGQVCRVCLIKIRNGCSQKKIHTDFTSDHVWSRLITSDHVWSCLIKFLIMSDQVSDHVWSCLIMFDQLSAEIVPNQFF